VHICFDVCRHVLTSWMQAWLCRLCLQNWHLCILVSVCLIKIKLLPLYHNPQWTSHPFLSHWSWSWRWWLANGPASLHVIRSVTWSHSHKLVSFSNFVGRRMYINTFTCMIILLVLCVPMIIFILLTSGECSCSRPLIMQKCTCAILPYYILSLCFMLIHAKKNSFYP
jgi:hypothetical protein